MSLDQPDHCEECEGLGEIEVGGIRGESDGCRVILCPKCFPDGGEPEYDKEDRD